MCHVARRPEHTRLSRSWRLRRRPTHLPPAGTHDVSDVVLAESDDRRRAELSRRRRRQVAARPPPPIRRHDKSPRSPAPAQARARSRADGPVARRKVDDFEIVRMLGRGAFGHVYLARQMSLDRLVALKISANRGSEGRTMARLEHQHIVQVFSETVDPDFNQRLLCMQLVPGIGLEKLIGVLHAKRRSVNSSAWATACAPRAPFAAPIGPAPSCSRSSTVGVAAHRARSVRTARPRSARRHGCRRGHGLVRHRLAEALDFAHTTACCIATSSRPTSW